MRASWGALRERLVQSISTWQDRRTFTVIRGREPSLTPFHEPEALVSHLVDRRTSLQEKDVLVAALVRLVQAGGPVKDLAERLLWLGFWQWLDHIYLRCCRRGGDAEEALSELQDTFTRTIAGADLQAISKPFTTLPLNVERRMTDSRKRRQAEEARIRDLRLRVDQDDDEEPCGDPLDEIAAPEHRSAAGRLVLVGPWAGADHDAAALRHWLYQRIGRDTDLVLRVAVLGDEQGAVALDLGINAAAARKRYRRAIALLQEELQLEYGPARGASGTAFSDGERAGRKEMKAACPIPPARTAFRN